MAFLSYIWLGSTWSHMPPASSSTGISSAHPCNKAYRKWMDGWNRIGALLSDMNGPTCSSGWLDKNSHKHTVISCSLLKTRNNSTTTFLCWGSDAWEKNNNALMPSEIVHMVRYFYFSKMQKKTLFTENTQCCSLMSQRKTKVRNNHYVYGYDAAVVCGMTASLFSINCNWAVLVVLS